jgi:hypothetical protein
MCLPPGVSPFHDQLADVRLFVRIAPRIAFSRTLRCFAIFPRLSNDFRDKCGATASRAFLKGRNRAGRTSNGLCLVARRIARNNRRQLIYHAG